jgi:hypothetical protein
MRLKKIVIISFVLLSQLNGFGQLGVYQPINFNASTFWNMSYKLYHGGPYIDCSAEQTFEVLADTIINNKQYWKTHNYFTSFWVGSTYNCYPYFISFNNSFLYLREDSLLRKVFKLNADTANEIELVNYGLMPSDTLNLENHKFEIDSVGIENINGTNRRVQYFTNFGSVQKTIEGVGCTMNMPISFFNEWGIPGFELQCFNNNGSTLFSNTNFTKPCIKNAQAFLATTTEKMATLEIINSNNFLLLNNTKEESIAVNIYTIAGQKILNFQFYKKENKINLSGLTKGIYLVEATTKQKRMIEKIVIE